MYTFIRYGTTKITDREIVSKFSVIDFVIQKNKILIYLDSKIIETITIEQKNIFLFTEQDRLFYLTLINIARIENLMKEMALILVYEDFFLNNFLHDNEAFSNIIKNKTEICILSPLNLESVKKGYFELNIDFVIIKNFETFKKFLNIIQNVTVNNSKLLVSQILKELDINVIEIENIFSEIENYKIFHKNNQKIFWSKVYRNINGNQLEKICLHYIHTNTDIDIKHAIYCDHKYLIQEFNLLKKIYNEYMTEKLKLNDFIKFFDDKKLSFVKLGLILIQFRPDLKEYLLRNNLNLEYLIDWWNKYGIFEYDFDSKSYLDFIDLNKNLSVKKEINLIGFFSQQFGLNSSAKLLESTLREIGYTINRIDVKNPMANIESYGFNPKAKTIFICNGDTLSEFMINFPIFKSINTQIGYWVWETISAPKQYEKGLKYVDEIWTPSQFSKNQLKKITKKKIHVVRHYVRQRKQIELKKFVITFEYYLIVFDFNSDILRKNPEAAIKLYLKMNTSPSNKTKLVIKTLNAELNTKEFNIIKKLIQNREDVILINRELKREDLINLIYNSKAVLHLHRSEGFGLLIMESLSLGVPCLFTGFSAPVEFVKKSYPLKVKWKTAEVPKSSVQYGIPSGYWAEPDENDSLKKINKLNTTDKNTFQKNYLKKNINENRIQKIVEKLINNE